MQTLLFVKDQPPKGVVISLDLINDADVGSVVVDFIEDDVVAAYLITDNATIFIVSDTILTYKGRMNKTTLFNSYYLSDFKEVKTAFEGLKVDDMFTIENMIKSVNDCTFYK